MSNHIVMMDLVIIPVTLPRKVTFPAKAELFDGSKSLGCAIATRFLKAIGMVLMDRGDGRASAASLKVIFEVLGASKVIGIFPEGTRLPNGRLYKGKTGMAHMVPASSTSVLSVGLISTQTVRGFLSIPWMRRPVVVIGEPLDFSDLKSRESEIYTLCWVTEEVQAAIQCLIGQEYADVYATRVKYGDLKEKGSNEFLQPRPGGRPRPAVSEG